MQYVLWGAWPTFYIVKIGALLSYQVIARKWRPKNFQELIGQHHISQTLINALRNSRLPHALLFTGPRGTGKTSSARILAKSLRCPNAVDFTPCDNCSDCEDISIGRCLNVHELDGASNNGVDAIRELQESVHSMPSTGSHKLYIIDEVHMLSISAFNALLKTLEEPPDHVIFVLATTEVQKIPDTILSRCQRFDFRRIPLAQVAESLKKICDAEKITADEGSLWMIAKQGEGSMRDSQSLLDQVIAFTNGDLSSEKVIDVLGLTDRTLLFSTIKSLIFRNSSEILDAIEKINLTGNDPKIFIEDLLQELRNLLVVKAGSSKKTGKNNSSQLIDLPESDITSLKELIDDVSSEDIHFLFDMTLKGASEMAYSTRPNLILEMLLLRMAEAPTIRNLVGILQSSPILPSPPKSPPPMTRQTTAPSSKSVPGNIPPPPNSQPSSQQTAPSSPPPPPKQEEKVTIPQQTIFNSNLDLASNWLTFVKQLSVIDRRTSALLENTQLVSIDKEMATLGINQDLQFLFDQLKSPRTQETVKNHLKSFWKKDFQLDVIITSQESATQSPKAINDRQKQTQETVIKEKIENHPLVKEAQEKLNVKIDNIKESL